MMALIRKKVMSILFMMALLVLVLPTVPAKAVTIDATATVCKGRIATMQLTGVPTGYKVVWKNTDTSLCSIVDKSLKSGVARCKVKGKATTKGVIIKGKLYNKAGKFVHTYNFKLVVKAHKYTVTRKSTCQKQGKKVCDRCGKIVYLKKKAHTYKWIYGGKVASGRHLPNDDIHTFQYKTLSGTGSSWAFRDDMITNSIDLTDEYGTPYSHVASQFSEPYPTTISDGGKVYGKVKTWTVKYNNTWSHYAQGGTWSGFKLLDRKLSRSDTLKLLDGGLETYDPSAISSKFDSEKDIKGYADVTRWYSHSYSNGFLGDTWQNTYSCRFWQSGTPGKKMYVLMYSDAYYRYFVYTYTATCH